MSLLDIFKKKEQPKPSLTQEQIIKIIETEYPDFQNEDYKKILETLKEVCALDNVNINDLKLVTIGQDSIVLEASNKIFKITNLDYQTMSLALYVSNSNHIEKPNIEKPILVNNAKIAILSFNKLKTDKIRDFDVLDMYSKLREDGYLWYDPLKTNIGKDENGNLLLFDYGQLIYIKDKDQDFITQELNSHRKLFKEFDEYYRKAHEEVNTRTK